MSYAVDAEKPNLGDAAIVFSVISALEKSFPSRVEICLLANSETISPRLNVKIIKYGFWTFSSVIKAIILHDVFVIGGGEFLTDRSNRLYSLFNLVPVCVARLLNKKVLAYGVGIDDPQYIWPLAILLARVVFHKKSIVTVRDESSRDNLSRLGVKAPIYVTADPAVNLVEDLEGSPQSHPGDNNIKDIMVIVPRQPFHSLGSKSRFQCLLQFLPVSFRVKVGLVPATYYDDLRRFKENIAGAIDYACSKYNLRCVLLPMYGGTMSYHDDILCRDIARLVVSKERVKIEVNVDSPKEVAGLLSSASLVIGAPLHSLILATSAGVPAIGLAYHPKITSFMKEIGLQDFVMPAADLNSEMAKDHICQLIDIILSNREGASKKLAEKFNVLREREKGNTTSFKKLMEPWLQASNEAR